MNFVQSFRFEIARSLSKSIRSHYHHVDLTEPQIRELIAGKYVTARTSHMAGHSHEITLIYEVAHYENNVSIEHCKYREVKQYVMIIVQLIVHVIYTL